MRSIIVLFISLLSLTACQKPYDFDLGKNEVSRIVIDAALNNSEDVQYIKITRMHTKVLSEGEYDPMSPAKPVDNAVITVTDDQGTVYEFEKYIEFSFEGFRGEYRCKSGQIAGVPGQKFYLHISADGKEYTAETVMQKAPDITNIRIEHRPSEIPGKSDQYIPLISFTNASDNEFYLMRFIGLYYDADGNPHVQGINRTWEYSIISSRFLNKEVVDLAVDDGQSPDGSSFYYVTPGNDLRVYLCAITEADYRFYESLNHQFENDGGAFQPAPASAPSNISNNAIGLFSVADASVVTVTVPEDKE